MYNSSIKLEIIMAGKASNEKIIYILPCDYAKKLKKSTRLLINFLRSEIPYFNNHATKGQTSANESYHDKANVHLVNIVVKNKVFCNAFFSEYDNVTTI